MSTTEERAAAVFGEWREGADRGERVDADALCSAHPDLTALLRRKFAALRHVERACRGEAAAGDGAPEAASLAGRLVGPYRLGALLGTGGMGTVHVATVEARAPGLAIGDSVAVKVVHPHLLTRPGFFKRFLREAEIGRSIRHENVVRTLDADQVVEDGEHFHFFVMERVEGKTLRSLLDELGRVPEELCRHVGREVAKALAAIHAVGAVHRDVKPENVLITREHVVKVMDLGVARLQDEVRRLSQTGAFVGSVRYAAPEQFRAGGADADGRADLYALGLTLYELSTGRHPFADEDFHVVLGRQMNEVPRPAGEVNPQLSAFFEALVARLVEKDREKRIASAAELAEILELGERSAWWRDRATAIRVATRRPLRRIRIPRETALYGRDAELARLRALFDRATAGDGRVVLVEGEAGIGKSRLVDEFVGLLQREGEDLNFLFGGNAPGGAATASGAFTTAYREQFGDEGLEATLAAYLTPTPILVPAFAALLRGEGPPEGQEPLTKDSLQTVFVHATRALAAERTTIVLIDDLHFAPQEGRALFASLAMAVPGHRVLLVGTARPGIDEKWLASLDRLEQTSRMPLARLSPKDLARLLVDAFHSQRLAEELSFKIAAKSDGNPYFVFEILRGLRDGQFIRRQPDGTWVTTRIIAEIEVPSTVKDLIFARIGNLPTEERNLLDVAACAGFEFDPVLVGAVVGLAPIPALQRLAGIEKSHRLVRSAARRFVFDHHQVAEVLYDALPEVLREHYHASIASAIEAQHGAGAKEPKDLDGALCVDLAEHFLKGAKGERALRYIDAALTHLERGYLNDAAVRLADHALAVPGLLAGAARGTTLLRLATRLDLLGLREPQEAAIEEARTLARDSGDGQREAVATLALGVMLTSIGRYAPSRTCLERSLALSLEVGDRHREASSLMSLGVLFRRLGDFDQSREHLARAVTLAREIGDRKLESSAIGNLGNVFNSLGRFAEARELHERGLALKREVGDHAGEALAVGNLGADLCGLGHLGAAQEHHERHLALTGAMGDRAGQARATLNLGVALAELGRFAPAHEYCERSLALAREVGDRRLQVDAISVRGTVLYALGRYAEASEDCERCLVLAREIGSRRSEAVALVNRGELRLALGCHSSAREALEAAIALCREIGARHPEGCALGLLGRLADERGDMRGSALHFEESLALRRATDYAVGIVDSLAEIGDLCRRAGDVSGARAALDEALALSRERGLLGDVAHTAALLACLPGGDVKEAVAALTDVHNCERTARIRLLLWQSTGDRAHLAEAKRLLDHLVAHAPPDCRESMIANVRLHREIAAAAREQGL